MPRDITVIVKLAGGSRSAGLHVKTADTSWEKSESNGANDVFRTKRGHYRIVGETLELIAPGSGHRVGKLVQLDPRAVTDGRSGSGLSDEAGTSVTWKVEGILEL
ncbi:hypothetical protein J5288_14900 [Agrobacterium sp. S2/73]|uniref:hypothetical protein n=1 Tax=unclassified Agrobacterium TaxID=2632611 RepID=UPI001ADC6E55|nr:MULTISPECIES: hypothetical protein [unclassified Agrobacterium]MBO9110004.1 hypothetical protein [Agrobacterium sp. S2/73]QXZ73962.1 hypothetical protein J5276_15235 [Agrobacterium sp. S7/73]